VKREAGQSYGYVDNFVIGGTDSELTFPNTTEPVQNPSTLLGLELVRMRDKKKVILVTMCGQISDLCARFPSAATKTRNVPMPTTGCIVRLVDYLQALSPKRQRLLTKTECLEYMSIVGSLIWIQGIHLDIIFAVLYLSWFTKAPMHVMTRCIFVLQRTHLL
jgi:hypothetical protein